MEPRPGLGAVPGVVAVRSVHLTRGRPGGEAPFRADDAFVDVGASAASEIADLGIDVLSPVALAKRPHRYGDSLIAAPVAGRRAACAALLSAARTRPGSGTTTIAFVVEQNVGARGLATIVHEHGPFDEMLMVDGQAGTPGTVVDEADSMLQRRIPDAGRVHRLGIATLYAGSPVETASLADAEALRARLAGWIGGGK